MSLKREPSLLEQNLILDLYHVICPSKEITDWFCERVAADIAQTPFHKYSQILRSDRCIGLVLLHYKEKRSFLECSKLMGVPLRSLRRLRDDLLKGLRYESRRHLKEELMQKLPEQYLARSMGGQIFSHGIPIGHYVRITQGYTPKDKMLLPEDKAGSGDERFKVITAEEAKQNPWGTGTYRCGGQYLIEIHNNWDSSD